MKIENLVRKNILSLKPYVAARHSHTMGLLLDANENTIGSTYNEFQNLNLNRYPDPYQKELRKSVGKMLNVDDEQIFFGVGSDEIIDLLIRIFCEPSKDSIIVCEPTYGMYRVCADINNIYVINIPLSNEYDVDDAAVISAVDKNTKIIFLCSPNNPTANILSRKKILNIAMNADVLVVVDEAYIDFADGTGLLKEAVEYENIVVIRTFSKAWGLAGVRCGYSIGSKFITNLLFKIKAPYNLNKLTSHAVAAAIQNKLIHDEFIELIKTEKERIVDELKLNKNIINVINSDANFISFKVEDPITVFNKLEQNGIIIRDRSNQFNFGGYLRVTVGTKSENDLFLLNISRILK
jgi:histidinol-phosphate aminotransferase